jgi:hypothetical protein
VFKNATTYTCLFFLGKKGYNEFDFAKVDDLNSWHSAYASNKGKIPAIDGTSIEWNFEIGNKGALTEKLKNKFPTFKLFTDRIAQGIRTSANQIYVLESISEENDLILAKSKELNRDIKIEKGIVKKFLQGKEIKPYNIIPSKKIVIIPYNRHSHDFRLPKL